MATLEYADMFKRNNWDIFLDKIKNGHTFRDMSGKKEVKILLKEDTIDRMKRMGQESLEPFKKGSSYYFPIKNGELRLTNIYKSADFGGVGSTVKKEDLQLESLNKQIKDYLSKNQVDYIPIIVENKKYQVVAAESTKGTPKSDFHLIDINDEPCVWISHKDGNKPTSFQQYGGMTEKGMFDTEKELKDFINVIRTLVGNIFPSGRAYGTDITKKAIKGKSIYGIKFGGVRGEQNVNVVLQGSIKIDNNKLVGSSHTWNNGFIPSGDYDPILMVRRGDRNQFGIQGARFVISPRGGRKKIEMI